MTLFPGILMMCVSATVASSDHRAVSALFICGFLLSVAAFAFLGHRSYSIDSTAGALVTTKRYFLVRIAVCRRVHRRVTMHCCTTRIHVHAHGMICA
jgi:hypothetical protein